MKLIISVEKLSKRYIKSTRPRYDTLRDRVSALFNSREKSSFLSPSDSGNSAFWALQDVSFTVNQGDVVGIVGRNGAGKSTLLKILSRITQPTTGRAQIRGRVGSLLEVGTGFHPELTGRENVFLNGAILGMRPAEVQRKFDEIVSFSGVESFLDTPVKRYSSGMITRLAFSVAAHLEPEVLIVDEVLSVGDSFFRKKSIGKMKEVSSEGRTILFVSHNLNAIRSLCTRAIHLKNGKIVDDDDNVDSVVANYLNDGGEVALSEWATSDGGLLKNKFIMPLRFYLCGRDGDVINRPIASDEDACVVIEVDVLMPHPELAVGYQITDDSGDVVYWTYTLDMASKELVLNEGKNIITSRLPENVLNDGDYKLTFIAGVMNNQALYTRMESQICIKINISGNKHRNGYWSYRRQSVIAPVIQWHKSI